MILNPVGKFFISGDKDVVVATDGGRFDVHVHDRKRMPIFWDQPPNEVRRCSWFYKNPQETPSFPYEENFSSKLEVRLCLQIFSACIL